MKVLYLSTSGDLGGAERNLLDVLSVVREARPEWQLELIAGADGPLATKARDLGVSTAVLPFPACLERLGDAGAGGPAGRDVPRFDLFRKCLLASPEILSYIVRLRTALARTQPQLIHSVGFKMHVLSSWSKPANAALLWHIHDYVRSRPLMASLLRRHSHFCDTAVTNSRSVAADFTANCGSTMRAHTVYNGIDLDRFSPSGDTVDLDQLSGLPAAEPGTIRVGLVATFARWKGHLVYLRALAALPQHLPVRGYVVGGNIYRTAGSHFTIGELRSEAAKLGLSAKVGFAGFLENSAAAMRSLDVVVHASTEPEPFGLVIAEAMSCGKPVIVAEAGGALEISSLGINALGHTPGDAAQLTGSILSLVENRELRARLGAEGRRTAEKRFDRKSMVRELLRLYDEISLPRGLQRTALKAVAGAGPGTP